MLDSKEGGKPKLPQIISVLSQREKIMLGLILLVWAGLLLAGLLVPTAPYREALSSPTQISFWQIITYGTIVLFAYTITNVPILCCLAALLGAIGGRAKIELDSEEERLVDTVNPYASAVLRAFFVYLIVLAGTMVSIENPVENFVLATQEQYVRLAVMLSAIGFLAGYSPSFFSNVVQGAEARFLQKGLPASDAATPEAQSGAQGRQVDPASTRP